VATVMAARARALRGVLPLEAMVAAASNVAPKEPKHAVNAARRLAPAYGVPVGDTLVMALQGIRPSLSAAQTVKVAQEMAIANELPRGYVEGLVRDAVRESVDAPTGAVLNAANLVKLLPPPALRNFVEFLPAMGPGHARFARMIAIENRESAPPGGFVPFGFPQGYRPVLFVEDRPTMAAAREILARAAVVGVDTETKPAFRKGEVHKTSLVQLATPEATVVVDVLKSEISMREPLRAMVADLIQDPSVVKVALDFQDFRSDMAQFNSSFQNVEAVLGAQCVLSVNALFKALYPGSSNSISLKRLCAFSEGTHLVKREQCSNWNQRPLTSSQLQYAALDAFVLLQIQNTLHAELVARDGAERADPARYTQNFQTSRKARRAAEGRSPGSSSPPGTADPDAASEGRVRGGGGRSGGGSGGNGGGSARSGGGGGGGGGARSGGGGGPRGSGGRGRGHRTRGGGGGGRHNNWNGTGDDPSS